MKKLLLLLIIPFLSFGQFKFTLDEVLKMCDDIGYYTKKMESSKEIELIDSYNSIKYSGSTEGFKDFRGVLNYKGTGYIDKIPTTDSILASSQLDVYKYFPENKNKNIPNKFYKSEWYSVDHAYNFDKYSEGASAFYSYQIYNEWEISNYALLVTSHLLSLQINDDDTHEYLMRQIREQSTYNKEKSSSTEQVFNLKKEGATYKITHNYKTIKFFKRITR